MNLTGLGGLAEDIVTSHLSSLGWRLQARNWRGKGGELDLVAYEGATLVFVEVKARSSRGWGLPEEAVSRVKQGRIARTALEYMRAHKLSCPARFDVAAVEGGKVRLIKAAFPAPGWTR